MGKARSPFIFVCLLRNCRKQRKFSFFFQFVVFVNTLPASGFVFYEV